MKNKKSLGQNWLKDRTILEEIADLAADFPEESLENPPKLCYEIGPGLGTLTSSLLKRFEKVIAIEFDDRLAENLPKSFPGKNLVIENADVLEFDFDTEEPFVVAGNIPYYITTPIIKKLLGLKNKPEKIVLLVQKEVAEKVAGNPSNSSLSLFVKNLAEVSLGPVVKREFFTPPPKVDSQVLILTPRNESLVPENLDVNTLIRISFTNPRKKLSSNLSAQGIISKVELENFLSSLNLDKNSRPSDLSLNDYATLAKTLKKR